MIQHIIDAAEELLEEYGGRDIIETAENSGANVWLRELGTLKGFYIFENNRRYIVINEALDGVMRQVVCAHELGHDLLHRELSAGGIRENTLFLTTNKTEREANLFAAEVLISDRDFFDGIDGANSLEALASVLCLPAELVRFKIDILNFKGYDLNGGGANSGFLA